MHNSTLRQRVLAGAGEEPAWDGGAPPLKPRSALARFEIPIAITVESPNALNPPLTHG